MSTKGFRNKSSRQLLPNFAWFGWILVALILAGCEPVINFLPQNSQTDKSSAQQKSSSVLVQSPASAQMEAQIRQQINHIRQQKGLNPLKHNERLAEVARKYSQTMARKNFFSHTEPNGDTSVQRVHNAGIFYWVLGENLFKSTNVSQPVGLAVSGWMNSPGHRENILRPEYSETGVGIWQNGNTYYITQLFIRSQFLPTDLFR